MTARTLSTLVVTGLIVSLPAYAQEVTGDIVDQILHPPAQQPAAAPPPPVAITQPTMPPPAAAPVAATMTPAPSTAPAPTPLAPTPLTPASAPIATPAPASPFPVSTMGSPDIVGPATVSLPAEPSLDSRWGGFYGGINVGGGWTEGTSASSCINSVTNSQSGCTLINPSGPNTAGLISGGQFGYMKPFDLGWGVPLVAGAEVDLEGSGMSGTQSIAPPIPLVDFTPCTTCSFYAKQSLDWMASLRARVGVPVDDMLIYATGGLMFGGANAYQNLSFSNQTGTYTASAHEALSGPTFGGGVEFRLWGPWTARLEGLYYDLGKMRTVAEPTGNAFSNFSNTKTFAFRGGIIRLALNLRLGDIGWGF
jgi:outer membrane immunogenic protein